MGTSRIVLLAAVLAGFLLPRLAVPGFNYNAAIDSLFDDMGRAICQAVPLDEFGM